MLEQITMRQIEDFFQPRDNVVDELGAIDRQIKELESVARKLKSELIARGVGKYQGVNYVAEVQQYDRATINPTLVRDMFDPVLVQSLTEVKQINAVVVKLQQEVV
jgi:hypothetical protein